MKALKSNIWLLAPLPTYGTLHCAVCFLWQGWQSKRLFSSCPHIPVRLNINLSHRIWFLPAQPAHSSEASMVKPLKVSQIAADVQDPAGRDQMAVREQRSGHSLPGTALHDVRYILSFSLPDDDERDLEGSRLETSNTPSAPARFVDAVLWDRQKEKNFHLLPLNTSFVFLLWEVEEGCETIHELLPPECVQTQILQYEKVLPKWKLCSHGNYL